MAVLEVQSLAFSFPGRRVLEDLDLDVVSGEVVVVVGPNGAGKSTLLGVVAGRLPPERGRVLVAGDDVHRLERREAARRITGVAAEEEAAFPFTVRETVAMGRHPWRGAFGPPSAEDRARVAAALEAADLLGLEARRLPGLSSGERQRARVARCLAQGGVLALLDEPTAFLDLGHAQRVLEAFRARARREGLAVLAVLHDLNLAAAFADRVLLLVGGRAAALDVPARVLTPRRVAEAFGARVRAVAGDRPFLALETPGGGLDA